MDRRAPNGMPRPDVPMDRAGATESISVVTDPRIQTIREALDGEHSTGSVLPDCGDGLHWLQCTDCGTRWAENDDGSWAAGPMKCNHAPLAALDSLAADLEAAREALDAARDLYERVQMDESVGICLSERATTLILGDALARLSAGKETGDE